MRIRIRRRRHENGESEARAALKRAREDLRTSRARSAEVETAVATLRQIRERNHFAEMIARALQGS